MKRAVVLILDSFGIGGAPDAARFGDEGADTLGHIARACADGKANQDRQGLLTLPNMARLGLFHAHRDSSGAWAEGIEVPVEGEIVGSYACAREISSGKDTPSGHWEIAGVPVLFDWGYFAEKENSFPADLLEALVREAGLPGYLGNCHSSGTTIIEALGEEHVRSGKPIFYTSADSVFQIACHEEHFGLGRLYTLCELARRLLEPYNIGRVIARPFVGSHIGDFTRTANRRDYAVEPPSPTVLQKLAEHGGEVVSIGKIADIYAHCGITRKLKASGHEALFDATLNELERAGDNTLVMTNFVDFDMIYGHRRDVAGYAAALEAFDRRLPELLARLQPNDVLIITADHGCDPTWRGTDHTREQVPVLALGGPLTPGPLGARESYADIGQSLARYFGLDAMDYGRAFL
ncbi:phosphopentomutase [Phytohalomonas tamaricis]|uniref:phosphopentomutase n=1 Tax=Phytohalomonas tamaricis TaxID=2081032 RepID=UPI000D0B0B60|nr:phosphopentomutase [Phytohalomonas tamaricis]